MSEHDQSAPKSKGKGFLKAAFATVAVGGAALLSGCVVVPARPAAVYVQPGYVQTYVQPGVVVVPAPVFVAPAPHIWWGWGHGHR